MVFSFKILNHFFIGMYCSNRIVYFFTRYFDRYRDKKELSEQVLKMKLNMVSPFEEHPARPEHPLLHIHTKEYKPSWLKKQQERMQLRQEQFKDLPWFLNDGYLFQSLVLLEARV